MYHLGMIAFVFCLEIEVIENVVPSDFRHSYFSPGWEQCIKHHEIQQNIHGVRVLFPIDVTSLYITWMPKGHYQVTPERLLRKLQFLKK